MAEDTKKTIFKYSADHVIVGKQPATPTIEYTGKMKIDLPLYAKAVQEDGEQMLKVWDGDGVQVVPYPSTIHNYYLDFNDSDEALEVLARLGGEHKKELKKLLSTNTVQRVTKVTYPDKYAQEEYTSTIVNDGIQPTKDLIDRVLQEQPDFFRQFKGKELNILYFDIEQFVSEGAPFPTPDKPVLSISYAYNDEEIQHYSLVDYSERDIIHKFATDIALRDPDIIVGFNHCKYDVPVIEYKFGEFGVPNEVWSRENTRPPFHYEKNVGPATLQCTSVDGRIIFDVFHCTLTDQALSGESRGLKNVAKFYQKSINKVETNPAYRIDEIIEEDLDDKGTEYLLHDPPRLKKYNDSDVQLTRALFNFYFTNNKAISSFVGAPLNKVCPLASTYAFTQILGNILGENNYLADSTNQKRYPYAFDTNNCFFEDVRDGKIKSQKPYQGAISDCYKPGFYVDHIEDDVGSLYPSLMASLGAGPDNTHIREVVDFTDKDSYERVNKKGETETVYTGNTPAVDYRVEVDGDVRTYYLPDYTRKWTWVVVVNGVSPVAEKIKEFLVDRLEYKRRAKEEKSATLFAIAYALKVTINSCYGIAGSAVLPFGELGVAVLTTLTGQMVLKEGMQFQGEDTISLVDTDSYKRPAEGAKPIEEVNAHFKEWVPEVIKGEPLINWEREEIPAIICIQAKTYMKLGYDKEEDEYYVAKTGGALKGTKYTNIFNKVIDAVGLKYLQEGEDAAREEVMKWLDMEQYDKTDFIMSLRLGKKLDEYAKMTSQAPALALKYKEEKKVEPYVGMTMKYVVTTDEGYVPVSVYRLKHLDKKYYLQLVLDAAERLGLTDIITKDEFRSMTLDDRQSRLSGWV